MKKADPVQHTIDKKHSQMLEQFYDDETSKIPTLISEKKALREKARTLTCDRVDEIMELKDKIDEINKDIKVNFLTPL